MRGPHHPLRLGRMGCCSIRVRILNLTDIATISPMGWLRSNLRIAQIGRYLTHPLSVILFLLLLCTNGTLTHFNSVHLQLICNQQDKTLESTSLLSILPWTLSTLVPNPFDKDLIPDSQDPHKHSDQNQAPPTDHNPIVFHLSLMFSNLLRGGGLKFVVMWITQRQKTHYQSQLTKYNLYSQVCYSWDSRTNGLNNALSKIPRTPRCL